MALLFDASNEYVDCGSGTSLDNLDPITILCWWYGTGSTGDRHLIQKAADGSGMRMLGITTSTSYLYAGLDRATSNLLVTSNDASLSSSTWYFLGTVMTTAGANSDQKLYRGSLSAIVAEVSSYYEQTAGSGSAVSDAASNQRIGTNPGGTLHTGGRIAWAGIWNRVLTLGEIQAQQFRPHVTSGCVLFMHLGANGTGTQPDWSGNGNNGTVTGATVADHVPIRPWFGSDMYLRWLGVSLPVLGINVSPDNPAYYRQGVKIIG